MNELVAIDLNQPANLPAHLQGANLGASAGLLAVVGEGGNRIGLRGSRFRIVKNGKEEAVLDNNALDIIVVGAVPHISRVYYEGEYQQGEKARPSCFSEDGVTPGEDVAKKQADRCAICPQNQTGSKIVGGQKMKACGFFQRLVVVLADDPEKTLYRLDVKSQGLFGDSHANVQKYSLTEYTKLIANRGIDVAALVTRLSFDVDASVPKLLFQPVGFISAEQFAGISGKVGSEEVTNMLRVNMRTVDLSSEQDKAEPAATQTATPVQAAEQMAPATQARAQANVNAAAAARQQAPTAPKPQADTPKKHYKKTPKAGDFDIQKDFIDNGWTPEQLVEHGYLVEVDPPKPVAPTPPPAPVAASAPPAPPSPPPAPTGQPAVQTGVPMPGKPAPAAAPAPPAGNTSPRQVVDDAELQGLIAGLL